MLHCFILHDPVRQNRSYHYSWIWLFWNQNLWYILRNRIIGVIKCRSLIHGRVHVNFFLRRYPSSCNRHIVHFIHSTKLLWVTNIELQFKCIVLLINSYNRIPYRSTQLLEPALKSWRISFAITRADCSRLTILNETTIVLERVEKSNPEQL